MMLAAIAEEMKLRREVRDDEAEHQHENKRRKGMVVRMMRVRVLDGSSGDIAAGNDDEVLPVTHTEHDTNGMSSRSEGGRMRANQHEVSGVSECCDAIEALRSALRPILPAAYSAPMPLGMRVRAHGAHLQ